jgi:hypothetical protein
MRAAIVAAGLTALCGSACFSPVCMYEECDYPGADAAALAGDSGIKPDASSSRDAAVGRDASASPDAALRPDAGFKGDAGDTFCTGNTARVIRGTQSVSPVVTTGALRFMNCCEAVEIIFHTDGDLGEQSRLDLYTTAGSDFPLTDVAVNDDIPPPVNASMTVGSTLFGSGYSAAGPRVHGDIAFSRADTSSPLIARICLTLRFAGDQHDGERFYAPAALVMPYGWQNRFAIYLLSDRNVTPAIAAATPISSLVLAAQPLVDLYSIRFYRGAEHFIAFDPIATSVQSLKTQIGTVPVQGLPFVAVADNQRIYVGEFWTAVSSLMPTLPFITVDSMTSQGVGIELPENVIDPRADGRILKSLAESGKLAP